MNTDRRPGSIGRFRPQRLGPGSALQRANGLLTSSQLQLLEAVQFMAYAHQCERGSTTLPMAEWNELVCHSCFQFKNGTGDARTSIHEARQRDFAFMMGRFHALAGRDDRADYWFGRDEASLVQLGDTTGSGDTHRQILWHRQRANGNRCQ